MQDIITKTANKGGQIVLQDRFNYLLKAERQLDNTTYYVPLNEPLQPATQHTIREIVTKLYKDKYMTAKQMAYLFGSDIP